MSNEHVIEVIPAYVLDDISEEERARVQTHLAICNLCREEMRVFQLVLDELPEIVPQVTPTPALRVHLLRSVASLPQETVSRGRSSIRSAIPWPRLSFWQFLQGSRIPAWVGLGLILLLAISNLLLWQQVTGLRAEIASAETDMIVHPLHAVDGGLATGLVVMDPHGIYGTIIVDAVPSSPEGQQYQVWLSRGETIETGGLFTTWDNGYGAKVIYAPEPLNVYERIWVTIEPEGGSEHPTGKVVLQTLP
ncbi:MAG: anti-sigma factor [Anaerolineales bacterium]